MCVHNVKYFVVEVSLLIEVNSCYKKVASIIWRRKKIGSLNLYSPSFQLYIFSKTHK